MEKLVWVEDDGSVRELTPEELAYVSRKFHPADSDRPYVKARYRSLTPDGRMRGFLARSNVPLFKRIRKTETR